MSTIETMLTHLQERLESIAFLVSQGTGAKEVHTEIVHCLVILTDVKKLCSTSDSEAPLADQLSSGKQQAGEVKKVRNRLRLWAGRQSQFNSRILNAFLELEKSGMATITESDLRRKLADLHSFDSNFAQMKIIAQKNHGKIFEKVGDTITLWGPVIPYVRDYERACR